MDEIRYDTRGEGSKGKAGKGKEEKRRVTCFQDIVTQALHEGVVLISFEGWAVLRDYFIEALDAAVAHSLRQEMR